MTSCSVTAILERDDGPKLVRGVYAAECLAGGEADADVQQEETVNKLMMTTALLVSAVGFAAAQNDPKGTPTASCSFQDGKQITVRYANETSPGRDLPCGKVWTPGGQPMLLFTQAPLSAKSGTRAEFKEK